MTQVKKAFQPVVDLLEANPSAKVSALLPQILAMCAPKAGGGSGGTTFVKDAEGNTVAILDYYFKRWMPLVGPDAVKFGAKAKTATGYNSMCKEGVSHWTKAQREAKNASEVLLADVAAGKIKPADIPARQAEIETARKAIVETKLGFADEESLMKYLHKHGVKGVAKAA